MILQRQIYDRLRRVAAKRHCQLIIATHSEVILDGTSPSKVISFLGEPHKLIREEQRDQVREAMKRLTTLDLLLAEQGRQILYCEGESDFKILKAWATVLHHPARRFFDRPFFHSNEGRNPREAREHLFALRAIYPGEQGLLLLDGDNRGLPEREISGPGLIIHRWKRYEIENYLLVPEALRRYIDGCISTRATGRRRSSTACGRRRPRAAQRSCSPMLPGRCAPTGRSDRSRSSGTTST